MTVVATDVVVLAPTRFLDALASAPPSVALAAEEQRLLRPDHPFLDVGRWVGLLVTEGNVPVARLVASIDPRQSVRGAQVGCLGFVTSAGQRGPLASALAAGCAWLTEQGASVLRAPVQMSTWYGQRLRLDEAGQPLGHYGEPAMVPGLRESLEQAGFAAAHEADTYRVDCRAVIAETEPLIERVLASGIRIRSLRLDALDGELAALHAISLGSFASNWGYSPISLPEFAAIYRPLAARVDPGLVLLAEGGSGRPVGFVFALLDGERHSRDAVLVVKSIAVHPMARRELSGIGRALLGRAHVGALQRGVEHGYHVLVARGAFAAQVSSHWGTVVARYASYERDQVTDARPRDC